MYRRKHLMLNCLDQEITSDFQMSSCPADIANLMLKGRIVAKANFVLTPEFAAEFRRNSWDLFK